MTGPEHHREAERLVELARAAGIKRKLGPTRLAVGGGRVDPDDRELYTSESSDKKCRNLLADAQVHATLALAAATLALGTGRRRARRGPAVAAEARRPGLAVCSRPPGRAS